MNKLSLSDYTITKDGKIIRNKTQKEIKLQKNSKGYLRAIIGKKKYFVHRLVAEKYVPNPLNKPQVNHIDGNKTNNNYTNLEWVTNQENRDHAMKNELHLCGEKCSWAKLTLEQAIYIKEHRSVSSKELAKMFNVSNTTIKHIWYGQSWK